MSSSYPQRPRLEHRITMYFSGYESVMTRGTTAVTGLRAAAYEIPTDAPESDGTLAWDSTVLVVVEADADGRTGLGYTYAHQAVVPLVAGKLRDLVVGRDVHEVRAT